MSHLSRPQLLLTLRQGLVLCVSAQELSPSLPRGQAPPQQGFQGGPIKGLPLLMQGALLCPLQLSQPLR